MAIFKTYSPETKTNVRRQPMKSIPPPISISSKNVMNKVHNVTISSPPSSRKLEIKPALATSSVKRERTLTRTLEPNEIVLLNKDVPDASRSPVKEPITFEINFDGNNVIEDKHDNDYNYESDFESYESDFESETASKNSNSGLSDNDSCSSSALPTRTDNEKLHDSGAFDLSSAKKESLDSTYHHFEYQGDSGIYYNDNDKNVMAISVPHKIARGAALLKKIHLDVIIFDFFELKPSNYENYIINYGQSDRIQKVTQTDTNTINQDMQTDLIETESIWTQFPAEYSKKTVLDTQNTVYFQERTDVGNDENYNISTCDTHNNIWDASLKILKTNRVTRYNKDRMNFNHMNYCLQKFSITVASIIQNKLQCSRTLKPSNIKISNGYYSLNFDDVQLVDLKLSKVLFIYTNHMIPQILLTVHASGNVNTSVDKTIILMWNLTNPATLMKILVTWSVITCAIIHHLQKDLVIAGMKDGSISIWNLKETSNITVKTPSQIISPQLPLKFESIGSVSDMQILKINKFNNFFDTFAPKQVNI